MQIFSKIMQNYNKINLANENFPKHVTHNLDKLIITHFEQLQLYENRKENVLQLNQSFNTTTKILESSKKELIDLKKITRKDLKKYKTYINKYIIGKIIFRPYKLTGIHLVIEDEFGLLIKISFYNFKEKTKKQINKLFEVGKKICVIEPYFKFNNGSFLRIDNPSNVVFNFEIPDFSLSYLKLKERGNFFFIKKNYQMAILYYTEAIKKNDKDPLIFSNRAIARIKEKNFLTAIEDCDKAIKLDKKNPKFFYRKAIALKELHLYKKSLITLSKTQNIKEISILKKDINQRIKEKEGNYNFDELFKNPFKINKNISDFIGSIKIKKIKNKGRGIIATKNIKKGELISVTKAFSFGKRKNTMMGINQEFYNGGVRREDGQQIYYSSVNRLDENPLDRLRFSFLFGGFDSKNVDIDIYREDFGVDILIDNLEIKKENEVLKMKKKKVLKIKKENKVLKIKTESDNLEMKTESDNLQMKKENDNLKIERNEIEIKKNELEIKKNKNIIIPKLSSDFINDVINKNSFSADYKMYFRYKISDEEASGLWLLPSFYNHSCIANGNRYILGNIMFIRARKNILKGEEINLFYFEEGNVLERQWGFICKCEQSVCFE